MLAGSCSHFRLIFHARARNLPEIESAGKRLEVDLGAGHELSGLLKICCRLHTQRQRGGKNERRKAARDPSMVVKEVETPSIQHPINQPVLQFVMTKLTSDTLSSRKVRPLSRCLDLYAPCRVSVGLLPLDKLPIGVV